MLYGFEYLSRHPKEKRRVQKWRRALERFMFLKLLKRGLNMVENEEDLKSFYEAVNEMTKSRARRIYKGMLNPFLNFSSRGRAICLRKFLGALNRLKLKLPF